MATKAKDIKLELGNPKETILQMLKRLEDGVDFTQIIYHLEVMRKIDAGLRDIEDGNFVDQEEAEKIMEQWIIE